MSPGPFSRPAPLLPLDEVPRPSRPAAATRAAPGAHGPVRIAIVAATAHEAAQRQQVLAQAAAAWQVPAWVQVLGADELAGANTAPHVVWVHSDAPTVALATALRRWRETQPVAVLMDGALPQGEAWACLLEAGDVLMGSSADLLRWLAGRNGAALDKAVPSAPFLVDAWRSAKARLWPTGMPAPSACLRQAGGERQPGRADEGLQWLDSASAQGWLNPDPSLRRHWTADADAGWRMQAGATVLALAKGFVAADAITLGLTLDPAGRRCPVPLLSWSTVPTFTHDDGSVPHTPMPAAPGIYAIVDSAERLARCAEHGAQIVQLRTKLPPHPTPQDQARLRQAIAGSIEAAHAAGAALFINDHRQAALDLGASGLHLGQEDLLALTEMQRASLRQPRLASEGGRLLAVDWAQAPGDAPMRLLHLGISSHSVWELARARALAPDYIACGPVWATTTKDMPWHPQGLRNLRWWVANAGCPVVAIGGILSAEQIRDTAACGAAAVCVVRGLGDDPARTMPAMQQALAEGWARAQAGRSAAPVLPHPSLASGFGVPDVRDVREAHDAV